MGDALAPLPAEVRAVVEEEEILLARVRAALEAARRRAALRASGRGGGSEEALRSLRDEAARASEADLPALLHDLSVQHRLAERPLNPRFPDARSPYIAHLRVDEGRGAEDYLLGYVSFFDTAGEVRIVDWRVAPVAKIFYRYREGDRYEETFPGRVAEGTRHGAPDRRHRERSSHPHRRRPPRARARPRGRLADAGACRAFVCTPAARARRCAPGSSGSASALPAGRSART